MQFVESLKGNDESFRSLHKVVFSGINGPLGHALDEYSKGDKRFSGFSSQECDLTNRDQVRKFFADKISNLDPQRVAYVHLAARSGGVSLSQKCPATLFTENMEMAINAVVVCKELGIKRVIMALSTSCYADHLICPDESQLHLGAINGVDYGYAYAKRMQDVLMRTYNHEHDMDISAVLINGIVGARMSFSQDSSILPASLIRDLYPLRRTSKTFEFRYDPRVRREYTGAKDLARAINWCLWKQKKNTLLNIGNSQTVSMLELLEIILSQLEVHSSQINAIPETSKARIHQSTSNERFVSLSGFSYTPLFKHIGDAIRWYRASVEGKIS